MGYLLTQLEAGDSRRYNFYLSELRRYDIANHTRRDFFKHMQAKEGLQKYQQAGMFLRKYRPMFEAAVPAWAAKANVKLRATLAEKRRRSLAAQTAHNVDESEDEEEDDVEFRDPLNRQDEGESGSSSDEGPRQRRRGAGSSASASMSQQARSARNARGSSGSAGPSGTQYVVSDDNELPPRSRPQPRASGSRRRRFSSDAEDIEHIGGDARSTPQRLSTQPGGSAQPRGSTQRPVRPSAAASASAGPSAGPSTRPPGPAPSSPKRRRIEVIEVKSDPDDAPDAQEPTPAPTPGPAPPPVPDAPAAVWQRIDRCAPACAACAAGEVHRIPASSLRRLMLTEEQHDAARRENARLVAEVARLRNTLANRERDLAEAEARVREKEGVLRDKETIIELQKQLAAARR